MSAEEPVHTQRNLKPGIVAELDAAGFEDAEEIGRGGFGIVYRCAQRSLDRTVAVKVLSADLGTENIERFLREEHAMGRLSGHPNIVAILQVDVTFTGRPFIVMPFHERGSFEGVLRDDGPLPWPEAVRVGVKLAGAIESAHREGILHRDIKPANILLTDYGEPQLTDFGIARVQGSFETSSGEIAGSPAFTAPEVLRGETPTPLSDVYGLGATLFCLITGHAAFERHTGEKVVAQFLRITSQPIPDLRAQDIPGEVATVIEQAMAREPAERPASAAAFGEMLQEIESRRGLAVDDMALRATVGQPTERRTAPEPPRSSTQRTSSSAPPTASTKYRPPTHTRALLHRRRAMELLRAGGRRRLALIHAPAGFGKSMLAAQWGDALADEGVSTAWLSIDTDDDNVAWFLTHVIEAVRRSRPEVGDGLAEALEEQADDATRYVLTSLIDEIHASGRTVALIIDDWHRVSDEATIAAMDFLLEHGCHHLRLVVTSRTRSGLPLSRLRVRDELVEIDSDTLRLDRDETRSFLVDHNGLGLTADEVDRVWEATEGWIAALALVTLSLRGHSDVGELISRLSGRHHAIGEYLVENVLDALDSRMLDFLMSICITERVSGGLAAALAEVDDGQALLAEAEERDLFIRRIDDEGEWFRIQMLFAEFLRRRLEREQPGRARALHLKASLWFAEHQLLRESVDHALAAADLKRAMDLVESSGMDLIDGSRLATLFGLVAKLPTQQVVSRSKLMMAVARANVALHRPTAAFGALDKLTGMLDRAAPAAPDTAEQRIEAAVLKAAAEVGADRLQGVEDLVADCLSQPDDVPAWAVSDAANAMSFVRVHSFDFAGALGLQQWAAPYHEQSSNVQARVIGLCYAGIAAREQLDMATAAQCFEDAHRIGDGGSGPRSHAARVAAAMLGDLYYERGDLTGAEAMLGQARLIGRELGSVDFMIAAYVTGARVKAAAGDRDSAAAVLSEGAVIAADLDLPRLAACIVNERNRWGIATENEREFATRPPTDGIAIATVEIVEAAAIRALLAEHTLAGDDRACTRARALHHAVSARERPRAELQAGLLLTATLFAASWIDEAEDTLAPIVARCAELGIGRILLDADPQVGAVLERLRIDEERDRWQQRWPKPPKHFLAELLS